MRDWIAKDRLIVKLLYTSCCVWVGTVVLPLTLLIHDPDTWEADARSVATGYVFILAVLLPIWIPFFRRRHTGFPREPLEAARAIWAVFAPIAAMFVLVLSLVVPISFMFDSSGNDRVLAFMVALVGAALIVLLSWDVAAERDLVPNGTLDKGSAPPASRGRRYT